MRLEYVKSFANTSDLINKAPNIHPEEAKRREEEEKKREEKERK